MTFLVHLKVLVEPPEQVNVDVFEQSFDVVRSVVSHFSLKFVHKAILFDCISFKTLLQDQLAVEQDIHHFFHVRVSDFLPEIALELVDWWVADFFDGVVGCLGSNSKHFVHLSFALVLDQGVKLVLEFHVVQAHLFSPVGLFQDQVSCSSVEVVQHSLGQLLGLGGKLVIHCISAVLLSQLFIKLIENLLANQLELGIETQKQHLEQVLLQFLLDLDKHLAFVLVGVVGVVSHCLGHYGLAIASKVGHYSFFALKSQGIDFLGDHVDSFLLDFVAPEVGDHLALVRQVQFFLVTDHVPSLVNEDTESINRHIVNIALHVNGVFGVLVESSLQFVASQVELVFLENFVRQHGELKLEKVLGFLVFELFWLIDFGPDVVDVNLNLPHYVFSVVSSVIKVSENKH